MSMKRNLLIYAVSLAASIVLGRLRPGFISTMIFYMILCLPAADLLMILWTYKFFRISHDINKRTVVKGQTVRYEISLVNPTFLVFSPIKVYYTGDALLFSDSNLKEDNTLILYPFSRQDFKKDITCKYRGSYSVGVERVDITGFFGLFFLRYRGIETHKILVYPTIHELKPINFKHVLSDASESIVSFDKFDKSIFSDIRAYQPGDALNKIHWKLSAREGDFITKEFEGNVNNATKIMVNNESLELGQERNIVMEDYLIEGVVALSKYLLNNNTPLQMHWHHYDNMKEYGNQPKDFSKFYEALAIMNFEHDHQAFIPMIESETRSQYDKCVLMVFTPKVDDTLCELLLKKKRQGFEINIITINPVGIAIGEEKVSFDVKPLYRLIDIGVKVYHLHYENGTCRLEVA